MSIQIVNKQGPLIPILLCLMAAVMLQSCTQHHALKPVNDTVFYGETGRNQAPTQTVFTSDLDCSEQDQAYAAQMYRVDQRIVSDQPVADAAMMQQIFNRELPLSVGDLVEIQIEDGDGFTGKYVIHTNGTIDLPYLKPIVVIGMSVSRAAEKIEMALIREGLFLPTTAIVNISVMQWAPIEVAVTGAVYQPGQVTINDSSPESVFEGRIRASGDHAAKRTLSAALSAASGVRPDAKVNQIILIRNGWQLELDLSGMLNGESTSQISLVSGDRIVVPTTGCFQKGLMRPSQITPKGFRVFMSNQVIPSEGNAASAVGNYSSNLPYGSRLLHAVVSANCAGGTQFTNAARKVVLASINPITNRFEVVERSIEDLMRNASRDDLNPYLMPNDAIACYDSDVTNLRDIARGLSDVLSPLSIIF